MQQLENKYTGMLRHTVNLVVFIVIPTLALSGCPNRVPATLAEALRQCEPPESYQLSMAVSPNQSVTELVRFENGVPVRIIMKVSDYWFLTARDEEVRYMYHPKDNTAFRIPLSHDELAAAMAECSDVGKAFDTEVPIIGTQMLDGVRCWVAETQGRERPGAFRVWRGSIKIWVDQQYGLLRQSQFGEDITELKYSRINEVPNSEFELPEGVEVRSIEE